MMLITEVNFRKTCIFIVINCDIHLSPFCCFSQTGTIFDDVVGTEESIDVKSMISLLKKLFSCLMTMTTFYKSIL